jgi:hypothetical protein
MTSPEKQCRKKDFGTLSDSLGKNLPLLFFNLSTNTIISQTKHTIKNHSVRFIVKGLI